MDGLEKSLIAIQRMREEQPDMVNAYLNYTSKVKAGAKLSPKEKRSF